MDPGNLVGAGEQTLLTTIVQYDPIYAFFDMNERELLTLVKARPGEQVDERGKGGRRRVTIG